MCYERLIIQTIINAIKTYEADNESGKQNDEIYEENPHETPPFIWSQEFGELTILLRNKNEWHYLAKAYETFGILEANTDAEPASLSYIATTAILCGCHYYNKIGNKDYATALANLAYLKSRERLEACFQNVHEYEREIAKIYHIELLADLCIFFDKQRAEDYYMQALSLFETIDEQDEMAYTCEYAYVIPYEHYSEAIRVCYGEEMSMHNLDWIAKKRINVKMKLLKMI